MVYLSTALQAEIEKNAIRQTIPGGTEILKEGQFVKVVPLVEKGLLKVFTRNEDRELLLYYIQPEESCVMSFSACLKNEPSKVFAVTEEETTALLLPADKVKDWMREFPELNALFFQQYNLRYTDLLSTINNVLFDKMDKRLLNYLQEKVKVSHRNPLKLSHKQIANDLGTAREVVSRIIKKLENEKVVEQLPTGIKVKMV